MSTDTMQTEQTQPGMYDVRGLARRLNMSPKWVRKHVLDRRLPGIVKCGRSVRFDRAAIERRALTGDVLLPKGG